jgi:hypothetical protein
MCSRCSDCARCISFWRAPSASLRFLRTGLGILLLFVAAKMLLADVIEIRPLVSLAVVAGIFGVAIVASRLFPRANPWAAAEAPVACTHRDQIRKLKPGPISAPSVCGPAIDGSSCACA